MEDTKKLIGARLRELRRNAGMTQETLAAQIPMDARHLSRLEVGRHFPSLDSLERLAVVLDVPLAEFFQFPSGESTEQARAFVAGFAKRATPSQLRAASTIIRALIV